MNNPSSVWYWKDWFSSFELRNCSLAARGLWVDILGLMASSQIKGALLIGMAIPDSKTIAKVLGAEKDEVDALMIELESNGVYSKLPDGTIINRRMYREYELSKVRSSAGKAGAASRWQHDSKADGKQNADSMASVGIGKGIGSLKRGVEGGGNSKPYSQDDIALVQMLVDYIQKNNPNATVIKNLTEARQGAWINECRLMRESDHHSIEEIKAIITFSQTDAFWKSNILSMPKLREKWDQLWMKAKKDNRFQGIQDWLENEKG